MFPVIYFLFVTAKCLSYRGTWSLSHKHHTNGHMYYYKQTGNKTCYVRRKDEPQVLAEYKERQMWRQERRNLNQQLMEFVAYRAPRSTPADEIIPRART